MKSIQEHIDLIERYLTDNLSQAELDEFNRLLQEDNEFNRLFYEMDLLVEGVRRSSRLTSVEEKLATLEQALPYRMKIDRGKNTENVMGRAFDSLNLFLDKLIARIFRLDHEELTVIPINSQGKASVFTITGRIKLIAASTIIAILMATTFMYIQLSGIDPESLYAQNLVKPELQVMVTRSMENDTEKSQLTREEVMNLANHEYNQSNFGKALGLVERFPDNEKLPAMKYCGALSYMEMEQFERAKELLFQLTKENDLVWQHRSQWFLSLCLIRENNMEEAVKYLRNVSETSGGEFQEEAAKLIKKIDN